MILVNRAYSIVTPESAENGDYAESGMLAENEPLTFRELVSELKHGEPSCCRATGATHECVSHSEGETRAYFESGEDETRTIHYSRDNPPHRARYWRLAFIAAGLTK